MLVALLGLLVGLGFLILGLVTADPAWYPLHGEALLWLALVPAGIGLMGFTLRRQLKRPLRRSFQVQAMALWIAGSALRLVDSYQGQPVLEMIGAGLQAGGAAYWAFQLQLLKPRGEDTAVDAGRPYTLGHDAAWSQVAQATRLLVLVPVLAFLGGLQVAQGGANTWAMASTHLMVLGVFLMGFMGFTNLWLPQLMDKPVVASGALRGEEGILMVGVLGLSLGFGLSSTGMVLGFGSLVFLATFLFIGISGANIMQQKSPNMMVTPRFVQVPFAFAALFWVVSAVMLGWFLRTVPDTLLDASSALRSTHMHLFLLGTLSQGALVGVVRRSSFRGAAPKRTFSGDVRGMFFLSNAALVVLLFGFFQASMGLMVASLAMFALTAVLAARLVRQA